MASATSRRAERMQASAEKPLGARIAGQGALLFSGYALAQIFSFARNALIAHWLSKGDFGIAAAILVLLQTIETLSDLGADRLLVQARDGDDPRLMGTAHTTLVARGLLTALVVALCAVPTAAFFRVPDAAWAFAAAALVPLLKGFVHLDSRLAQRRLDNQPQMLIEVAPQALALALAVPVLHLEATYAAVLWLAVIQAVAAVAASHLTAHNRYRLGLDRKHLQRLIAFGWPIWASAFPLVAVYQGDRMLIGRMIGMEGLAAYTTAFMITMVPGLVAAKIANALMLPLLASAHDDARRFTQRFALMAEATALGAALYLIVFIVAGNALLPVAFGDNYTGLGGLVGWLAGMWALRMLQAVPGAALLAKGVTAPFFTAGMIRAGGLLLAFVAVRAGYGLAGAAAAGSIAELASLVFVASRLNRGSFHTDTGQGLLGAIVFKRGLLLLPAAMSALAIVHWSTIPTTFLNAALAAGAVSLVVSVIALVTMPQSRQQLLAMRAERGGT